MSRGGTTRMELERLEEFVVLARELNFGRAAAKSHASCTAFSRHIHELRGLFRGRAGRALPPATSDSLGRSAVRFVARCSPPFGRAQDGCAERVTFERICRHRFLLSALAQLSRGVCAGQQEQRYSKLRAAPTTPTGASSGRRVGDRSRRRATSTRGTEPQQRLSSRHRLQVSPVAS